MAAAPGTLDAPIPARIDTFLARFSPEIAAQLRAARAHLATHVPRGFELVYDNVNALVFAFAPSERASEAIFSVAGYPRWITLFFLHGATLADPARLLEGNGKQVRGVRLVPATRLHEPGVQALIEQALARSRAALDAAPPLATVIRAAAARQRAGQPRTR